MGWIKSNKIFFLVMVAFTALPIFFIDKPSEFITTIVPMYSNEYLGIAAWIAAGKPIWQTAIAAGSTVNVSLVLLYLGFDVGKTLINFCLRKKRGDNPVKSRKITNWLSRRGLAITYLICLVPGIPFILPAAVFLTNIRQLKYGVWILITINFIRGYFTVWMAYKGVEFFPLVIEFFKRLFS